MDMGTKARRGPQPGNELIKDGGGYTKTETQRRRFISQTFLVLGVFFVCFFVIMAVGARAANALP